MYQTKLMLFAAVALMAVGSAIAIIGGQDAAREKFPYFAYLKTFRAKMAWSWKSPYKYHTCGGAVISNQWILTAAQCLTHTDGAEVVLGIGRLFDTNENGREIFNVTADNYHIYPGYDKSQPFINDIALIKLPSTAWFSKYVNSIPYSCLPTATDTDVIMMGFGRVSVTDKIFATRLQYSKLKTVDLQQCVQNTENLISQHSIICADNAQTQANICKGDVGSPLVSVDSGKLIGIAGYADKNCKLGHTHGFTGISAYMQWIESVIEGVICKK